MTIQDIKSKLDIITVAENYGFKFSGTGNRLRAEINRFRDEKTSSLDFFKDTQKFFDRGDDGVRGDVIDVIRIEEGISNNEAIQRAKEMAGGSNYNYTKREVVAKTDKEKNVDFKQLSYFANSELRDSVKFFPTPVPIIVDGVTKNTKYNIDKKFQKLLEGSMIDEIHAKRLFYVFKTIIGYSRHWQSPSIVIRDSKDNIVDLASYRPKKPTTYNDWFYPKYIYKNTKSRGDNFNYLFETLVVKMIERKCYFYVGEGLKNALNALIYDVPFISIESTSNTYPDNFLQIIKDFLLRGYGFATAFDGDEAGRLAYISFFKALLIKQFNHKNDFKEDISDDEINDIFFKVTGLKAKNIIDFNSKLDFTDFVRADNK